MNIRNTNPTRILLLVLVLPLSVLLLLDVGSLGDFVLSFEHEDSHKYHSALREHFVMFGWKPPLSPLLEVAAETQCMFKAVSQMMVLVCHLLK